MGGTALSEGIGEILSPLPEPPECIVVLAKPDLHISTKYVYDHLDLSVVTHPPVKAMVEDLEKKDLRGLCSHMGNVLESVTGPEHPEVGKIEEIMKNEGALQAVMSGSGPTVFGIYEDAEKAEKAKESILAAGLSKEVFVSRFTTPERN
jgi:4-diphosphocytidyl-2-C-methyl-D-erythritol kinase